MTKKEILYAAYKDEPMEEGLSYAIYLAGLLGDELRVVLLERRSFREKFDDLMTAITFAEANEHESAREALSGREEGGDTAAIHALLKDRCSEAGINVNIHTGFSDTVMAVKDFLQKRKIDMVLLSPELTRSGHVLKRLVKTSPRPVVTMAH